MNGTKDATPIAYKRISWHSAHDSYNLSHYLVVLLGDIGVGKTFIANRLLTEILNAMILNGFSSDL